MNMTDASLSLISMEIKTSIAFRLALFCIAFAALFALTNGSMSISLSLLIILIYIGWVKKKKKK